ncbi:MAG: alpha/beta fold hydrolase [Candidatus Hodarchaeales archaeon]|jgi:pimeloyl-ACP methyl ester carboxylesterase
MSIFRTYGQKPYSIVVVHGGPGAGGEMAPIARQLSSEWGVLEPIQTEKSIETQIQELKGLIDENVRQPIIVIGHSWGAWLSLLFAVTYSSYVEFEEKYVPQLGATRTDRLTEKENVEFQELLNKLKSADTSAKEKAFNRLGELASKTDDFDPIMKEAEDRIRVNDSSEIYQRVWTEAAELRKSGQLLEKVKSIVCPVVAIHGDYDPHPSEGVEIPLSQNLLNFKFFLLKNCGHSPWLEKKASTEFYQTLITEIENI